MELRGAETGTQERALEAGRGQLQRAREERVAVEQEFGARLREQQALVVELQVSLSLPLARSFVRSLPLCACCEGRRALR